MTPRSRVSASRALAMVSKRRGAEGAIVLVLPADLDAACIVRIDGKRRGDPLASARDVGEELTALVPLDVRASQDHGGAVAIELVDRESSALQRDAAAIVAVGAAELAGEPSS